MAGIQLRLQQRGQLHCDVFNMDESPSTPGLPLTKVYGLPGEKGTQANTDDHQRFTTIICLCGDGRVLPAAFIISNSIESDDQSGQRVLSNLLKDANFNGDGQWTLRTWKKKLMVAPKQAKKSAAAVEIEFTRPYLIHPDGRIVWSQRKAYMDTPGAVLYLDVLLNPYRIKSGRRNATLIWDNCKTHNRPCVLEAFEKSSFFVDFLPKNMTDSMQPVDIIACGPLKAGQRRCAWRISTPTSRSLRPTWTLRSKKRQRSCQFTSRRLPPSFPASSLSRAFSPQIFLRPPSRTPSSACSKAWA